MKITERKKRPRIIGWREYVSLPELGLSDLNVKIDTGARTSALHAHVINISEIDGVEMVEFNLLDSDGEPSSHHIFPVYDFRAIKNTSGIAEQRYVILTKMVIGTKRWTIDVALSDRAAMKHDMILGRKAIRRRNIVVDPGRSYLQGKPQVGGQ